MGEYLGNTLANFFSIESKVPFCNSWVLRLDPFDQPPRDSELSAIQAAIEDACWQQIPAEQMEHGRQKVFSLL